MVWYFKKNNKKVGILSEIEENKNKEKEENKIISNIVSQMMWNNEKNLYIN